jgi:tetratricopeptide (TPR) repeat protein
MIKKTIVLGIMILSFLSCKEDNKDKKPRERFDISEEINVEFENIEASALYDLSLEFYDDRNYNKAIGILKSALIIEKNPIIYNELGLIYSIIENYDEANRYIKKGQEIDSTYYPLFINGANMKIHLREFDSAELTLKKVIEESKSEYWKAYANLYLAILYYQNDRQCEKSLECFSHASAIKNDKNLKETYKKVENRIKRYCS